MQLPLPKHEWGRKQHPTKDELMIDWTGPGVLTFDEVSDEKNLFGYEEIDSHRFLGL